MRKLKSFNEASSGINKLWCVVVSYVGGWANEDDSKIFTKKMMAADYYIKYINDSCEQEFETYYNEDGTRTFFTKVEENEDLEMAEEYVSQNSDSVDIYILEIDYISTLQEYQKSGLLK